MSKYLFVLAQGPGGPEACGRVGQCLRLAKLAAMKGHEVTLFLMGEAVVLAQRFAQSRPDCPPDKAPDEVCQMLQFLRKANARIMVDTKSARSTLHGAMSLKQSLPQGLSLMSDSAMLDLAEDAKVFSF